MMLRRGRPSGPGHRHGRFHWCGLWAPGGCYLVVMAGRNPPPLLEQSIQTAAFT